MSNLNKLKKLAANKSVQLIEKHPLLRLDFETRLQYLSAIAMAVAVEREPNEAEKQAFLALAKSLSIDPPEAVEQLKERNSISEEGMLELLEVISSLKQPWLYLFDLAWMHAADGVLDEHETDFIKQLADILKVDTIEAQALHSFALALKTKNMPDIFRFKALLPTDEASNEVLAVVLAFTERKMLDVVNEDYQSINTISNMAGSRKGNFEIKKWLFQIGDFIEKEQQIANISYKDIGGIRNPFIPKNFPIHPYVHDSVLAPTSGILAEILVAQGAFDPAQPIARIYQMDEPQS